MQSMGTTQIPRATTLLVSGGDFFFPGPVFMTRGCIVHGDGGSGGSISKLHFPYNGAGIVADWMASPDAPGFASLGKIANLDLVNDGPGSIALRRLNWTYSPGDTVTTSGSDALMFRCTVGGKTVADAAVFDKATAGATVVEPNGTTWLAIVKTALRISLWQQGTRYEPGDIVFSTGFDLGGRRYGDSRFTFVCTAAGTSGSQDPFGAEGLDSQVQEPNGPKWMVNAWSAIVMRASIHADNIASSHWPNAAVHVNAALPKNDANNFRLTNIKSFNDGMGIYIGGTDANAGFIAYCDVLGPGAFTAGLGGHCYWDHSESGGLWLNNYAESGTGAGWINDSIGKTTWIGNGSEMALPNIVRNGAVTAVGNGGTSGWHPTLPQQLTQFDYGDGRGLFTTDSSSRVTMTTQRGNQGFIDLFQSTDDQGSYIGRIYNSEIFIFRQLAGWYTDQVFGDIGALPGTEALAGDGIIGGISGRMAAEGHGHPWTAAGTFVGPYSARRYFGYDPVMWQSNRLREGKRKAGDIFITNPTAGSGGSLGIVVIGEGTKGLAWQPKRFYSQKDIRTNVPADVVEPNDGFAYVCTRSGTSGMSPPPFAQSTALGVNAPVWTPQSGRWPGSEVRPTTANGHYFQMKPAPTWTPGTKVAPGQVTTTGDSNGNLFFAYVPVWSAGLNVFLGQYIQPSPPNGQVFRVKNITGSEPGIGATGSQQPRWSDLVHPPDELPDGTVVWQLGQLQTGQFEPPGVSGVVAAWDTRPGGVTYDNNIEWHFFVPKTGPVEPAWNTVAGSETPDTPGARIATNGSVPDGFGVVWVESGPDPAGSKIVDNTCEWTRIDTVPVTASVFPVRAPSAPTLTLSLNPASLTNVDDAAGRWQFEGGPVLQQAARVADYASSKRAVASGTAAQNTAMLTMTLFWIGQGQQAAGNMTLQGSHDFNSGEETGSVSAASSAYASYIGKPFKRSGGVLVIG
jgi:hypothetical protein